MSEEHFHGIRNFIFDCDGTLVDSREGALKCLHYALGLVHAVIPPGDNLHWFFGPPLRQNLIQLMPDADSAIIETVVAAYRTRYGEQGIFDSNLYPSVASVLAELKHADCVMFVATSKARIFTGPLLEHFGVAQYFKGIYGAELDGKFDDKKNLLAHLITQEKILASASVMIGDRRHDIEAAKACGMRSIGVLYGYGSREELEAAGADMIIGDLNALLAATTIQSYSTTDRGA